MFEVIGEFIDTTLRVALRRYFPPWLRSTIAAVLMLVVAALHLRLHHWLMALAYGHYLSLLLGVTLGTAGWLLFKAPFTRGARSSWLPWAWSGVGLALLLALLISGTLRGQAGFSEWYAVAVWSVSQAWYLRQSRSGAEATRLGEAFFLRALYGVPVFFFTCFMAAGDQALDPAGGPSRKTIAGMAMQAAVFHGVMLWVNFRIQERHGA